ncbi:MAG: hypothetical protein QGG24_02030 [Vicinamibacterales bacterium]|jgi:hypothetical protein|nr:hypothetical protein [Acidobacteriota bacterium]MDP7294074.1 hypothetical protein [Vicinamibacterales bacterium]MDP7473043.1 hypothetical protein [Vicinamibacterales bacterium]MDP7670923.1 hypothetical protein [Vicinamibacterales bacterium]HJO39667.1 hypothetical protein [Vicinamibacterales bacterium]
MPPRYAYWTIILDGTATSFRSATREELMPTLHQLRKKDAKAELMWFARGRLWPSPTEAREAARRHPRARPAAAGPKRDREWRPGGTHEDPRARFAKKKGASKAGKFRRDKKTASLSGKKAAGQSGGAKRSPGGRPPRKR